MLCDCSVEQCGAWHGEEMPLRQAANAVFGAQTQRTTNYPFSRGAGLKSALRRAHEREDGRMGITDELMGWMKVSTLSSWTAEHLTAIADRIDAAHEEALREAYTKGREDGMGVANKADMRAEYLRGKNDGYDEGYDAGFASADDWCSQHEDEMEKHGWVKLPKDADGEVIHLGDVVMLPDWPLNHHEVINLVYAHDGWAIISRHGSIEASEHTVHVKPKKPTVENLLREFALEIDGAADVDFSGAVTIAKYAKRLRLAGDAE